MSTALKFSSLDVRRFMEAHVEAALTPKGFSFDLARRMWLRSLGADIEHFVTLPTDIADNSGPVIVTVNLGVHCRLLGKNLARMYDLRRAQHLSTFTRNVGQLSARRAWRDWVIRDAADAERVARRLAARIISVGLPWLAQFDSLSAVAEGFGTYGREDHREHAAPHLERLLARGVEAGNDLPEPELGLPAILSLRIEPNDTVWHCDE